MGKSTISMVIFNSKLLNYQRVTDTYVEYWRKSPLKVSFPHDFLAENMCIVWGLKQQTSRDLTNKIGDWTTKRGWSQLQSQLGKQHLRFHVVICPNPNEGVAFFASCWWILTVSAWIKISCTHISVARQLSSVPFKSTMLWSHSTVRIQRYQPYTLWLWLT